MLTKAPRGTNDILPKESYKWVYVENLFRKVCSLFGYSEIRTPIFEHTELFKRGVGETTDIVQKEMYSFQDNGGRDITLKPEGTAPAVRAFIENKLYAQVQPTKLFYITPCFRYERPQAGRLRQFHQFGIEVFGSSYPSVDAEVIALAIEFLNRLNLKNLELRINSIGCIECRREYNNILREYLSKKVDKLCKTCQDRYDRNPLRILDCKNESCIKEIEDAPLLIDYICDECKDHFEKVKKNLTDMQIQFKVDPKIVRGLDYYNKTAFEIISNDIGSQSTVCGGGRYDKLVQELGGPETTGVGFGMGVERLLLTLENNNIQIPNENTLDIFVVTLGERAEQESFKILSKLRQNDISCDKDHLARSLKAQFKYSDKVNAKFTVVIGDDEIEKNVVQLKDMSTSQQYEIKLNNLCEELKKRL
ncbi:histidyl-tRNA synthetase [Alkalithermobacter thermoalcaliphilus JW-YL-7 = DSM 7308]|uniref:Histidine--tRNA ligase n=1 Tax=Alkalithermobacter thermoalcaliphilus JW-YL-7 = DSM 7308 TaxID=1121328 RepID=A0A150FPD3_CLOPD|nr:Histidyl-tRNA synthetase [[Clostridium] paradoxum JW-YL-7 = DSM 7308]SHK51755.1 histidyl-tRNA synthetase [[Clostridium] paradoxum JW-YL-7 = DSM 7308]